MNVMSGLEIVQVYSVDRSSARQRGDPGSIPGPWTFFALLVINYSVFHSIFWSLYGWRKMLFNCSHEYPWFGKLFHLSSLLKCWTRWTCNRKTSELCLLMLCYPNRTEKVECFHITKSMPVSRTFFPLLVSNYSAFHKIFWS